MNMKCKWSGVDFNRNIPAELTYMRHGNKNKLSDYVIDWLRILLIIRTVVVFVAVEFEFKLWDSEVQNELNACQFGGTIDKLTKVSVWFQWTENNNR